jgi:acylphosphatase
MRAHLRIRGRVQGVFFRESARKEALALAVRGWVKNLDDGSVEAVVEGEEAAVRHFIQWCHSGPPAAHVEDVRVEESAEQHESGPFEVRQ